MPAGDLTNLSTVRTFLALGTTNDDALLSGLITSASKWIEAYLSRPVAVVSASDSFAGARTGKVFLSHTPVVSVTSVTFLGAAIPAATHGGADLGWLLYPETGCVAFRGYWLPSGGPGTLKIDYTAGWTSVPEELAQACVELVALRYKERARWGQDSASNAGQSISFLTEDVPRGVKTILNQYRRVTP